jgi:hypothetical protein
VSCLVSHLGENPQKFRHGRDSNGGPQAWEQATFTTTLLNLCILHALTSFLPGLASSQRSRVAARAYVSALSAVEKFLKNPRLKDFEPWWWE